jgi:hypothetical protein
MPAVYDSDAVDAGRSTHEPDALEATYTFLLGQTTGSDTPSAYQVIPALLLLSSVF